MGLIEVIPATKLPLDKPQRFTYRGSGTAGDIVLAPLGPRKVFGLVVGTPTKKLPSSVTIKSAEPTSWQLPAHYVSWIDTLAAMYRVSPGLIVKLLFSGAATRADKKTSDKKAAKENASAPAQRTPVTLTLNVPPLTDQQQKIAEVLVSGLGSAGQYLVEGVTGSGKTEVYAHVAAEVLRAGKQVLLLVPEIAMATHLVERIQRYFGASAVVWHSTLTPKARHAAWERAASGQPMLLIGPRSTLFVPLPRLGAVIMDEEHDGAYKQWDQEPRFHARVAAAELTRLAQVPLILGSATPSIETIAKSGITRLSLPTRYGGSPLPQIELVDRGGTPTSQTFAPATLAAIQDTLAQKLQVLVLINRRGAAPAVLCQSCGHIWRCKRCERPLVWHVAPSTHLECHFCQTREPMPDKCPKCSNAVLRLYGIATQRVEAELRGLFPQANVARLDADISRSPKRLNQVATELASGATDILVGTQLVAKSWDIEKLHLVVILNADQGLLTADFRSHERTVQLLWQVAGRAGRRKRQGHVLIETMQPDHPALRAVVAHEYPLFVIRELAERKRFGYPPYRHVVTLYRPLTSTDVLDEAAALGQTILDKRDPAVTVLPARVQTLPRGKKIAALTVLTSTPRELFSLVPNSWSIDLDPESFFM